jgi:hypothetical protein
MISNLSLVPMQLSKQPILLPLRQQSMYCSVPVTPTPIPAPIPPPPTTTSTPTPTPTTKVLIPRIYLLTQCNGHFGWRRDEPRGQRC